ncbi:MAG TPA: twin-arginine translocation signal domain-containing protein [Actinomycetota bacterium]|nr:twin-arginine translocation signal domain-containing protein [Actinomycetota bacterium]
MDDRVSARRGGGRSDRRRFLKRLGATLAAGVGLAVIPATSASATTRCCRDDNCGPCSGGQLPYWCDRCGCMCISSSLHCEDFRFEMC